MTRTVPDCQQFERPVESMSVHRAHERQCDRLDPAAITTV